jgi:FG-GAP repeat protein
MKRAVCGLVLVFTTSTHDADVRGQSAGANDPVFLKRNFSPITYLKASNPKADAKLGFGSALTGRTLVLSRDGNTLVVSAPEENSAAKGVNGNQKDETAGGAGAVYVFTRGDAGKPWTQQAYLKASNTDPYDSFGFALALSANGSTLAVAATREDSNARGVNGNQDDNSAEDSGAVYVFTRTGGNWSQQAYVKSSNSDAGDQFGWSVALSDDGNLMVVGAPTEQSNARGVNGNQADNSSANAGAGYVFTRSGSTWTQQAYLKGAQTDAGDLFGFAVDVSGDGATLAISAYDEDGGVAGINGNEADNSKGGSGCAYVFVRDGTTWKQTTYLKESNLDHPQDAFGSALALSGDGRTLAIDAPDEDGLVGGINGPQYSGKENQDTSNGAIYLFVNNNGTWSQQAYIKSSNPHPNDLFGIRLAISTNGNVLVASSMLQGGGGRGLNANQQDFSAEESGSAYVFTRTGTTWTQRAYLKAPNSDAYDEFGSGIALSGDGNTLAIAAFGEDGGSAGIGGNMNDNSIRASGAVYVY